MNAQVTGTQFAMTISQTRNCVYSTNIDESMI